jgi:PPK2 family polyphosphate:nucleotide phosphotransferase
MASRMEQLLDVLRVPPGKKINLRKNYDPGFTGKWMGKDEAEETLAEGIQLLAQEQDKLYAQDNYAILMILQALDAAGKDGTIKHVMSGVNPQGVDVHSFKAPAGEELDHDYLWRNFLTLPRRGHIGIFNRSYYEEVLVVRVHPEFLTGQKLPPALKDEKIWRRRFEQINHFEKYLVENGIVVLKFFLNVSKEEQGRRFQERATQPEKNWKFSAADMKERERWDDYMNAFEDLFNHTSTEWAPWYIVPADNKWFTRMAVAAVLYKTMNDLNLAYPIVSEEQQKALALASAELEKEGIAAAPPAKNGKKKAKNNLMSDKKKKGKKKGK